MRSVDNKPIWWLGHFPYPKPEGHKYDRGNALIYGGSIMTGASRLAARAAQRIGTGLVTVASPKSSLAIYAEALESIIVQPADTLAEWKGLLDDPKRNAILLGPGMGPDHVDYVLAALECKKLCVLDADALTCFASEPEKLFSKLHPGCVLTPHEGEFEKLFGIYKDADKIVRTQKAAAHVKCTVLLKGRVTVIAAPDEQTILNNNAPPWLATAGAGDVLAGMILGLIAQGMPVFFAASAAAWMHGKIATDFGLGLIAEDIVAGIPSVLRGLPETVNQA